MGYKHMHFQLCTALWIKLHKKWSNEFLGFKDVTRFGLVIGILSCFSWQLNFPGASIKFQEISRISRCCRHPVYRTNCPNHVFPSLLVILLVTASEKPRGWLDTHLWTWFYILCWCRSTIRIWSGINHYGETPLRMENCSRPMVWPLTQASVICSCRVLSGC